MANTPILGIPQVSPTQAQKEVTINDAIVALESATNGNLLVAYGSEVTKTLSETQFTRSFLFTADVTTADAILQVPATIAGDPSKRLFCVRNKTTFGLTVRSASGTGGAITIPNGEARLLCIADDDVFVAAEPFTPAGFLDLGETPDSYAGKAGQFLKVIATEDGLVFAPVTDTINNFDDVDLAGQVDGNVLVRVGGVWKPGSFPTAITTFLGLTDVPDSYGPAGTFVRVNGATNGVEFIAINQVPAGAGTAGQVLTKGTGTAYSWEDPAAGSGVPAGGTTGQVLTKASDTDGDAEWATPTGGGGGGSGLPTGGTPGQFLAKASITDGDAEWVDAPTGTGGAPRVLASARVDCTTPATPIISGGINVGSVTKTGTGQYTITFTAPLADLSKVGFNSGGQWALSGSSHNGMDITIDMATGKGLTTTAINLVTHAVSDVDSANGELFDADGWFSFELYDVTATGGGGGGSGGTFATHAIAAFGGNPVVTTKSYNVSSVTRTSVGRFRVNFAVPFPDTDYLVVGGGQFTPFADNNHPDIGVDRQGTKTTDHCDVIITEHANLSANDGPVVILFQSFSTATGLGTGGSGGGGTGTESIIIAVSDETTPITAGATKIRYRMPYALTLTGVKASLSNASTSGNPTIDINENGVSILSTKLSIDSGETTSKTATTPVVISDFALAEDAEITIDIDTAGTGATGLKVYLIGHQ